MLFAEACVVFDDRSTSSTRDRSGSTDGADSRHRNEPSFCRMARMERLCAAQLANRDGDRRYRRGACSGLAAPPERLAVIRATQTEYVLADCAGHPDHARLQFSGPFFAGDPARIAPYSRTCPRLLRSRGHDYNAGACRPVDRGPRRTTHRGCRCGFGQPVPSPRLCDP